MEISNKTLAWLVVATIIVSLGATIISINKINNTGFTGFASNNKTGNASVIIQSQTTLNFAVGALNFGTGTVNGTAPFACNLSNNMSNTIQKIGNCDGFNTTLTGTNGWLQIENIGNTKLNVSLNFSATALTFIGGGLAASAPLPQLFFMAINNESGSCPADVNVTSMTWTNVTSTASFYPICWGNQGLLSLPTTNSMAIGINITIPYDAAGTKVLTIQASGSN